MQNGRNLVADLSGQWHELWWYWPLTTESEQHLATVLSESDLWWYRRLPLKREQCSFFSVVSLTSWSIVSSVSCF